jgi:hypothetical protein
VDLLGHGVADPRPTNLVPEFDKATDTETKLGALVPQDDFIVTVSPTQGLPLKSQALDDITSGRWRVYMHGRVAYKDIFQHRHWMTYCFYMNPDGRDFGVCDRHNEVDPDEE